MGPYAYLIVDSEVQLSTPTTVNGYKCLSKYSKIEQPIGEGRVYEEGGGKGGADFSVLEYTFYGARTTSCMS
jgi:hypothetical protein